MTAARAFAELKARGVNFKDLQPREDWWGFAADLSDPDGNHFAFMKRANPPRPLGWAKTSKKA